MSDFLKSLVSSDFTPASGSDGKEFVSPVGRQLNRRAASREEVAAATPERGVVGAINDNVIEVANAAAGGVSSIANMVSPGNRVSKFIDEEIIKPGEAAQSDQVKVEKKFLQQDMANAQGAGDEITAYLGYMARNPGLAISQVAGSFAIPGLAAKGASTGARALGLGEKAASRFGLGTVSAVGGAMAGGDAAGSAYDLVKRTPKNILEQNSEYRELLQSMNPDQALEEIATRAARSASVVPAAIGATLGPLGAERILAGAGRPLTASRTKNALLTGGVDAGTEGFEEGVTQYSGQKAASQYNPTIDPMKGVAGAATAGAVMGAGPGLVVGALQTPAVPNPLQSVVDQAQKPGSVLSRAVVSTGVADQPIVPPAGPAAGPGAAIDPISARVSAIEADLRSNATLEKIRGLTPDASSEFLYALNIAKNPGTRADMREQAITQVEQVLETAKSGTAFTMVPPEITEPSTALTVPGQQGGDLATQQGGPLAPSGMGQFFDPNTVDVDAVRVDNMLPGPRAIEGPRARIGTDVSMEPQNIDTSEQPVAPVDTSVEASPTADSFAPEAQQTVAEPTPAAPEIPTVTPGAGGTFAGNASLPAATRKRAATLRQLADQGFETVERRGNEFFLKNSKTGQELKLDGMADSQLARKAIKDRVDALANTAATSPLNDRSEPTARNIEANNWKKGDKIDLNGVVITIENPEGSIRRSKPGAAKPWETKMAHHYGEIKRTEGADGDPVDVFIGPRPDTNKIFVIDQVNEDGSFDEHKVMMGFTSEEAARAGYLANYEPGWTGLGAITEMPVGEFKTWAKSRAAKRPLGKLPTASAPASRSAVPAPTGQFATLEEARGYLSQQRRANGNVSGLPLQMADGSFGVAIKGTPQYAEAERQRDERDAKAAKPQGEFFTVPDGGKEKKLKRVKKSAMPKKASPRRMGEPRELTQDEASMIEQVAAVLGKNVVFFEAQGDRIGDGFILPNDPSTLYVATETTVNPLAVFGHEFFHGLRETNPEAWNAIAAVVRTRITDPKGFREDYYRGGDDSQLSEEKGGELEELVSDLGGNLMMDPTFWRDVFAKIREDHGKDAKGIIARLAAAIEDLIARVMKAMAQPGFRANDFVSDIESIRSAYKDGLADFVKAAGINKASMGAEIKREQQNIRKSSNRNAGKGKFQAGALILPDEWVDKARQSIASDEPLAFAIPIHLLSIHERAFYGAMSNIAQGRPSMSEGPVEAWLQEDHRLLITDGTHRYLQAAMDGKAELEVMVWGEGYSDRHTEADAESGVHAAPRSSIRKSADRGLTVEAYHFSRAPRAVLNTENFGTGLKGSARDQIMASADDRIKQRLSFYVDKGTGIKPEAGIGAYAHKATLTNIYDSDADPLRLRSGNARAFESKVLDAGFSGYLARMDGTQSGNVVLLGNQTIRPELLGTGPVKGAKVVPEAVQRDEDVGDRLMANRTLPAGQLKPDAWARVLMAAMPEDAAQLMDIGALEGDKAMFKDELAALARQLGSQIRKSADRAKSEYDSVAAQYKGTDAWMQAPNGEATKLSERQWVQVRTPSFKKWFGDWEAARAKGGVWAVEDVSKAVGENGEPLVVYHGSDKGGFTEFEAPGGTGRGDLGIWTTPDYGMARSYVRKGRAQDVDLSEKTQGELQDLGYEFNEGYTIKGQTDVGLFDSKEALLEEYELDSGDEIVEAVEVKDPNGYSVDGSREYAYLFPSIDDAVGTINLNFDGEAGATPGIYALFINVRNPNESNFEGAMWNGERPEQYIVEVGGEQQFDDDGRGYFTKEEALKRAEAFVSPEDVESGDIDAEYYIRPADDNFETTDDVVRKALRSKNDGAIIREVIDDGGGPGYWMDPQDIFVAFDPSQVKSADYNNGEFSDSTGDLRKSRDRVTDTPAFKRWFGDSKVVDEQGKPLVVYHGTDRDFSAFRPSRMGTFGPGIYFANATGSAESYGDGSRIIDAYVALQNPWIVSANWDSKLADQLEFDSPLLDELDALPMGRVLIKEAAEDSELAGYGYFGQDLQDYLKRLGYDGVIATYPDGSKEIIAFDPTQIKSATGNSGAFDSANPDIRKSRGRKALEREDQFEMSTRIPTAKGKAVEDHMGSLLISDFAAGEKQEKWVSSVANLVTQYPNYRESERAKTPAQNLERLVRHMADNLVWLHNLVPVDTRQRSKLWYDGANRIAQRMSRKYELEPAQSAGILAALSPQKDWFMNVSLGERVASIMAERQNFRWSKDMEATANRIYGAAKYQEDVDAIRGKTLADLDGDAYLQAMWVRTHDQAHNSSSFSIVSPEGEPLAIAKAKDGAPVGVAWGPNSVIAKSISIFNDGSSGNISEKLGGQHKVRNFFNNILIPNSRNGHVTIDTHAVAAALLRPLSGNSLEVAQNFGGASNAITGLQGTYALYEEAYRRAAESLGLLPRELQSITWEAIRGLYTPIFKKQSKNVDSIDKIWNQFKKGRLSYDGAKELALESAGGIEPPSWLGRDPGAYVEDESAAEPGDLSGDGVSRGGSEDAFIRAVVDDSGAPETAIRKTGDRGGRQGAGGPADRSPEASEQADADRGLSPLPDAPRVKGFTGPDPRLVAVAEKYARDNGITLRRQAEYVDVDPERATRIADAYAAMPHAPNDPKVKAAYANLIKQTIAQYKALESAGYKFWFMDMSREDNQEYASSPWNAMRDIRANKQMGVFPTADGFGSNDEVKFKNNPLEEPTEFKWPKGGLDGPLETVYANDLFRAVHDAFGHGLEGSGFRARGEENAWQAHVRLFTGSAVGAITSETRGQNSWLNYGPNGETNRTAKVEDTVFADQKTGLMPAWTWKEGIAGDMPETATKPSYNQRIAALKDLISCLKK